MENLLSFEEFADLAGRVVELSGVAPQSNRAKARPAPRMLRYYQQQGLLSEPVRSGRAHSFGRRHVLEVLAVKRLQSSGSSLGEIRTRLSAATMEELELLASPPEDVIPAGLGEGGSSRSSVQRRSFWGQAPAAPAASVRSASRTAAVPSVLTGVVLAPGVELVLSSSRPLDASSAEALRRAAAPLLEELRSLGASSAPASRPVPAPVLEESK